MGEVLLQYHTILYSHCFLITSCAKFSVCRSLAIPTTHTVAWIKLDAASSTYASQNGIHTAVSFSQVIHYILFNLWFIHLYYVFSNLNAHASFWLVGYEGRSP